MSSSWPRFRSVRRVARVAGWTGSFSGVDHDNVCDFIYDLAPGIVPYRSFNPGWNNTICFCTPPRTLEDCTSELFSGSTPCQAVGIEEMWTQLMITATIENITGECPTGLGLFHAGVYGERFSEISRLQTTFSIQVRPDSGTHTHARARARCVREGQTQRDSRVSAQRDGAASFPVGKFPHSFSIGSSSKQSEFSYPIRRDGCPLSSCPRPFLFFIFFIATR